ncbi:hypothetical protein HMPREF9104_02711 [Lentilactobacillus kisonensis F0435]|uniref:SAM-dependent methyltransferase n=1 Tax=Lentilactobacillus kisonensis F0435 TaxID=797516 RepID=H1LJB9_9LACO|nr:hypothetical protein HMPREF9104_02711 [Lentilactobacillus kisonensis F0435]
MAILQPRLADGLAAIQPNDNINVITIAGMGGNLIRHILEAGRAKLTGTEKLILQPNVGEDTVRRWLMTNAYQIKAEQILAEDGHIYEIITAVKVPQKVSYTEKELKFGPFLIREKSPVFIEKWQEEVRLLERVISNMQKASHKNTQKINLISDEIQIIKGVISRES